MHEDVIWLGPVPAEEECTDIGHPDYARRGKAECRAHIEAIRAVVGKEPEGARLVVRGQDHEFGRYFEAAVVYDGNNEAAADYASRCDEKGPRTWAEAGMEPPCSEVRRGR
jgi:hypothetical protein